MTGEKPMNCEAYHQAGKGSWKDYIFLENWIPMIYYPELMQDGD